MKIALVHQPWNDPGPPVRQGSIALWIDRIAPHLAEAEEVVVYGAVRGFGPKQELRRGAVTHRHLPLGLDPLRLRRLQRRGRATTPGALPPWADAGHFAGFARRLARDARAQGCDLVHIHNHLGMVPGLARQGLAVVLHMHCAWLAQLDADAVRAAVAPARALLGCSDEITARTAAALPELAARCMTVHNGVDVERFAPDAARAPAKEILYVGRLSPEKGVHVLVDAFVRLAADHPDARLTLVGPGAQAPLDQVAFADEPQLAELFARWAPPEAGIGGYAALLADRVPPALRARVRFAGAGDHDTLPQRFRAADVVVMPSVWREPFGMPVVEAMASGAAVVASRTGGIPEILRDADHGVLVPPGDTTALADALDALLRDPERRAQLGRAARQRACAAFTWQGIAQSLLRVYRGLADPPSPG